MAAAVMNVERDVSDIDDLQVAAAIDRAAYVEIVALKPPADPIRYSADSIRSLDLIIRDRMRLVGAAIWNAKDCDIGLKRVEIRDDGRVEEALVAGPRRDR
jgi:hypothetical protein